jgi:hypothetical protein
VGRFLMNAIPADLGNLERVTFEGRRKAQDFAGDKAEALGVVLVTAFHQDLNADADAEEGLASPNDVFADDFAEAEGAQVFHRGASGANARKNDTVGGTDAVGLIGYLAGMTQVPEGVSDAGKIASPVIDDRDHLLCTNRSVGFGMGICVIVRSSTWVIPEG